MLYRIDGFDTYPTGSAVAAYAQADGFYMDVGALGASAGRFGLGKALSFSTVYGQQVDQAIGKRYTTETCVVGQAIKMAVSPNGGQFGVVDSQGGTGVQWYLRWDPQGVIRLFRGDGTLIATTPAKTILSSQWSFVEVKHKVHSTSGTVEVRVNTVVVLSYTGNTQNGTPLLSLAPGWDTLMYVKTNVEDTFYWDDRYILDNTGSNNTDYLGNVRVNTQLVSAAGDLTQFSVLGAASNWAAVAAGVIDDSKYVYSPTIGQEDLYTMNPNVAASSIFGVQVRGAYRQDDSTQMKARNILKTGGTIYEGTDKFLSGTYTYYTDMWELNPFTGVGWTAANLNALQGGTKVVA